jgi:hypothetical protein
MSQAYSNPDRADDPHALPDVEVFYHEHMKRELCALNAGRMAERGGECILDDEGDCMGTGWYWWPCFPGCLPDSDPIGPFKTEAEALADAQDTGA